MSGYYAFRYSCLFLQQFLKYTRYNPERHAVNFTETEYFRKTFRCNVQVNLNARVWTSGTLAI